MLERMSKEDLKQFINDYLGNLIFTSEMLVAGNQENLVYLVFLPLALGAFEDLSKDEVAKIGLIYEYISKAGPRAINGYPTFMSMNLMRQEDWEIARREIIKEQKRRQKQEFDLDDKASE